MNVGSLTVDLDTRRLQGQLATLKWLLEQVPKRTARRFCRKALRLVRQRFRVGALSQHAQRRCRATQAGDGQCVGRFGIEVDGLDELIAAAARRIEQLMGSAPVLRRAS